MYQYTREGLGQPPRTPNPSLKKMCPVLRDLQGRYLDWRDYVIRTRSPNDRISKVLRELGEQQFNREQDYHNYIERCKQDATAKPTLQPWPPRWWIEDFIRMIKGLPPKPQTPHTPQNPTSLRMRANLGGWGGFGQPVPLPPTTPAPRRGFDPFKAAKEAAEKRVPLRPETPEERLQRILTQPVPTLPRGRSFKEWLDRKMAERRVPKWLRDSIWTSFFDKNWGLLSNLLSTAGFRGETKEAIIETARAAGEVKVR